MPDPSLLVQTVTEAPQLREAVVNEDATEAGQTVKCVEPGHSVTLASEPLQWSPYVTEDGVFYPKKSDRAVIATPDGGPPYIASWWPAAGASPDFSF